MTFDPESIVPPGAKIKVVGVGGGGGNAVNTMIRSNLDGVEFVACNTDIQALTMSLAGSKLQLGKDLTKGLGAGADPDVGREAALEDRHEIQSVLEGADMVFITAGMGGGTGTGGASIVAQIARELGALTVGVVTKPFIFEGKRRRKHAESGIARLRECVDTLITIPNQRLLEIASPDLSMIDAFKRADDVLVNAVKGISDIINIPGTVNVDFADVKAVMSCMGQALMGIGISEGANRASEAAHQAIRSPLLEDIDIEGATGVLVNITAGSDITLMEVNEACSVVQEAAHEDANFIFGAVIDESLGSGFRVTVIATGFPVDADETDGRNVAVSSPRPMFQPRLTDPPLTQRRQAPTHTAQAITSPVTAPSAPVQESPKPAFILDPPSSPAPLANETIAQSEVPTTRTVMTEQMEPEITTPEPATAEPAEVEMQETTSPAQETEQLARWTMGFTPVEDDSTGTEEIGGEEVADEFEPTAQEESFTFEPFESSVDSELDEIPMSMEEPASEPVFEVAPVEMASEEAAVEVETPTVSERIEGASKNDLEAPQKSLSDSLFDDEEIEMVLQGKDDNAPLDRLFQDDNELADDIDKKIDEALEIAERMQPDQEVSNQVEEEDDLDIPAFLRNGMKDLPLN